ncbi:MAG TPA: hypothetical protein VMX17_07205 [Candidatus Glassbacteria bacterium]|nr:hypothetical protein [Candidatus Glassbacteria bacterium]
MAFNRTDEYEYVSSFGSSEASSLQSSFEDKLSKANTNNITSQVGSSLGKVGYMNGYSPKKTTVAEMVEEFIERTGLAAYQQEVQALENKNKKVAHEDVIQIEPKDEPKDEDEVSLDGPSLIDIPGVKEAIVNYIQSFNTHQLGPVLNFIVEELKPAIMNMEEKDHEDLLNIDPHSGDPKLKIFITENIFKDKPKSLNDFTIKNPNTSLENTNDDPFAILRPVNS